MTSFPVRLQILTGMMTKPSSLIHSRYVTHTLNKPNTKLCMINHSLQIIQWNPNGFFSKLEEINLLLNKYSPISICLQETNFINNKVGSLKNYTTNHKNKTNAGRASGEVETFIDSNYHSEEIFINTNLEVVAVNVIIKIQ